MVLVRNFTDKTHEKQRRFLLIENSQRKSAGKNLRYLREKIISRHHKTVHFYPEQAPHPTTITKHPKYTVNQTNSSTRGCFIIRNNTFTCWPRFISVPLRP